MEIVRPNVTLLHSTPDPERVIERAGRVCYRSHDRMGDETSKAFIRMIKSRNHASVLEHASAGFIILTDRGVSHELVRHRIASYSQESTRYVDYSQGIAVIKPVVIPDTGTAFDAWKSACETAEQAYMDMLATGQKPEAARAVLPSCTATMIAMSANFREWLHFLGLRFHRSAHPDMRVIAGLIRDELVKIAPTVFEEYAQQEEAR